MIKPYNFALDIKGRNTIPKIECVAGDTNSYELNISLIDGALAVPLTDQTARLICRKADGTTVFQDFTIINALAGNISTILSTQSIACLGNVDAEIKIYGLNTELLTSVQFHYSVIASLLNDATVVSTNEYTALTTALTTVGSISNKAEQVDLNAETAARLTDKAETAAIRPTYIINPTDDPQAIFDAGAAGDSFIFARGIHSHAPINNGAVLYIDKTCTIELAEGAILKIPDNIVPFNATAEIIKNFSAVNIGLDDLSVGGTYALTTGRAYAIQVDTIGGVDTFKWSREFNDPTVWQGSGIPITGGFQTLEEGIQIKFNAVTGHTLNSLWLVCYGVAPHYGIRVGTGFQETAIDGVTICGDGTIDLNRNNQYTHNEYTKFLPCCVLVNGRVTGIEITTKNLINGARPVQAYGENTGVYNLDGTVTGGISYDIDGIAVKNTMINDCSSGHLFGFPEHRGKVKNLTLDNNDGINSGMLVELNHGLEGYSVVNNTYRGATKSMIILWRHSNKGSIHGNRMYGNTDGTIPILSINSPPTWQQPENFVEYDNLNIDSLANGKNARSFGYTNKSAGLGATVGGGENNVASNNYGVVAGGSGNIASGNTSGILAGLNNTVVGAYSGVLVGTANNISAGSHNAVVSGANNNVSGTYNTASGNGNVLSGNYNDTKGLSNSTISDHGRISGQGHIVNKKYANIQGLEGSTDWEAETLLANGKFTVVGDAKTSKLCLKTKTTTLTFVQMLSNLSEITIPLHTTVAYKITCIGMSEDDSQQGMWTAQGIVTRSAGDVSVKGGTVTKVYSDSATWDFQVVAYTTTECLNLRAHGDVSQNVRWVATVELTVVKTQ